MILGSIKTEWNPQIKCVLLFIETPFILLDVKDVTLMNTKYTKEQNVELLNKNTQYKDVKLIS